MRPAGLLLASLLAVSARAAGPESPYDRDELPLDVCDEALLAERGYSFDAEGHLIPPGGGAPATREDAAFLLEDLRSRRRLADLLQIKVIRDRASAQGTMTAAEKATLRSIGQRDWPLLTKTAREELKELFSEKELRELDSRLPKAPLPDASVVDPPPVRASTAHEAVPLHEPLKTLAGALTPLGITAVPGAAPSAAPAPAPAPAPLPDAAPKPEEFPAPPESPAATADTAAPAPAPVPPVEEVVALPAPWKTEAPAPTPPAAAPAAPEQAPLPSEAELEGSAVPEAVKSAMEAPVVAAAPVVPPPPPPAPPPPNFQTAAPKPPPAAAAPGLDPRALPEAERPAAPPAPAPAPQAPAYPPFESAAFAAFLAEAPYGRQEKELLQFLAANMQEPERSQALGVLRAGMPHVVLDSRRAGASARVGLGRMTAGDGSLREVVALHDGPPAREKDALLGADRLWLLPDDPALYSAWGTPVPPEQAFSRESGSSGETAWKWGRARVYPDGSRRLARGEAALAGALAHGLLLLDARTRIPGDALGARLRAYAGEFRMYQALERASGREPSLDRELMALYAEWRDRPLDFVDTILHSELAAGSGASRIVGEAGLGAARALPQPPAAWPVPGSPAEKEWLALEASARAPEEAK